MAKTVLIVDDDREILKYMEKGLIRYDKTFSVLTAADGLDAMDQLKQNTVSLVVTDLKMPRVDGFSLLAHIMEHYPEIPVIISTGYSTPQVERSARQKGAVGYISKPFTIDDLVRRINKTLRRESDGGTLHSISSGMFLQLVEMEEKTCTIRLVSKGSGRQGILFFRQGELLDARTDGLRGEDAAYEIFSWEQVSLSIQNSCQQQEKRIHRDLQAILLDAVRRKDEKRSHGKIQPGKDKGKAKTAVRNKDLSPAGVRARLAEHFGDGAGVEDVYEDDAWGRLLQEIRTLAAFMGWGEFGAGYLDRGDGCDFIVLPGERPTVVSVNPKCPRDRLMEILSEST
jgi:CheY-like chemotaxis protein